MNSRERLEKCLKGEPVDRPPVALWRHFPIDDLTPHHLRPLHSPFQSTYQFDLLKSPRALPIPHRIGDLSIHGMEIPKDQVPTRNFQSATLKNGHP